MKNHYRLIITYTDGRAPLDTTDSDKQALFFVALYAVTNKPVASWAIYLRDAAAPEEEGWDVMKGWASPE